MQDIPNLTGNPPKSIKQLRLSNLDHVKKSLSRITNAMIRPGADVVALRGAVYSINALISCYRIDFENRLEKLEDLAQNEKANR